jgi:hypothetical protein
MHLLNAISAFPPRSAAASLLDEPHAQSATAQAIAMIVVADRFRSSFACMRTLYGTPPNKGVTARPSRCRRVGARAVAAWPLDRCRMSIVAIPIATASREQHGSDREGQAIRSVLLGEVERAGDGGQQRRPAAE